MARRFAAAIVMCAVMVLVAAVPLALAGSHEIVKGPKGPNASAKAWDYMPTDYGVWTGNISNNGLRSLVVDVYDNSTGVWEQISHQRIRFAAYDAFPAGTVITAPVIMAANHPYAIEVTPNGPQGSMCTVVDEFRKAIAPTPAFTPVVNHMDVTVDASASTDDIGIDLYEWDFGDGGAGSGVVATHTYLTTGIKTIKLTVTDTDGLSASLSKDVNIVDNKPLASFTVVVTGASVAVDASGSTDDYGIVSYSWNWGDGTTDAGKTATHTYSAAAPPVPLSTGRAPPDFPYPVFGYVLMPDGVTPATDAQVTVTNLRTGHVFTTTTDLEYGYYSVDINDALVAGGGVENGDQIKVEIVKGTATATVNGVADTLNSAFLWLDATLQGGVTGHDYTITLTVTDTIGQTATISKVVTVYY